MPAVASEADDYLRIGKELYLTYHLAPKRLDHAIAGYEKALAMRPGDYEILAALAELYHMKGQGLGEDRKDERLASWEKGAAYGERAIAANPKGKEGHFYTMANIGAAAQLKGLLTSIRKFRRIKQELDRTLELDPAWPPALVAKAQYLTEMPGLFGGSDKEARRLYQRAAELDPHCSVGSVFLAGLQADSKEYTEAFASLRKVLFCRNSGNCGNWALVDCPKAVRMLERICGEAPDNKPPECATITLEACKYCPP